MPIGDVRIAGQINQGNLTFTAGEDPKGNYCVVTPAFVVYLVKISLHARELEAENRALRKKLLK